MTLIDGDGKILGVVNVIDAFVVLLILAFAVAGISLIDPFSGTQNTNDSGEPATRYTTIKLDPHSPFVVQQISIGDVATMEESSNNLTVTDIYITPSKGDNISVVIRARVNGREVTSGPGNETSFKTGNKSLRPGRSLAFETNEYRVSGTALSVGNNTDQLNVSNTPAVIRTTVDRFVAEEVEVGDKFMFGSRTFGLVESVSVNPTDNQSKVLLEIGLSLRTITLGGETRFGGQPLRLGATIPFETDTYDIAGQLVHLGGHEPPGELKTTTVTVALSNVDPEVANSVEVGMTEQTGASILARVRGKRVEPATVVLTSQDGDIHAREHPRNKDVYLMVELKTRQTDTGLWFHARLLQENVNITLDFGTVTVQGTVIEINR